MVSLTNRNDSKTPQTVLESSSVELVPEGQDIKPWERQKGEDGRAFEAFAIFRDLPTRNRTFAQVAEILYPGSTWAPKSIGEWSKKHNWLERVERWERELDRIHLTGQQETIISMAHRHIENARKLQETGMKALEKLLKFMESHDADELGDLSAADIRLLIVEGAKLERLSKGLSTDKVDGIKGGPDLSGYSDADLQRLVEVANRIETGVEPEKPD